MGKIIRLDDMLSNKIAAGEVVERPASVVKELLENAIDANSTIVEIDIEEAGLSKIRIVDNGDGIEPDDCLNAFHRHATSKIKDENDLFRIRTLGFRGEALPSIASVSLLDMKTSTGEGAGTNLILSGGKIEKHESTSSRKGTDITVRNLFFNTPARLKYMKTVHTELGNITDIVNRIALAHPEVSIRLVHNGKKLLHTSGNGDVRQVLASIYGLSIAKKMKKLTLESLDFEVNGYVALPEITRASRNYISTIINGRFIKNYSLVKAIQQGYHTLLPIGRFPIVFLEIKMDPLLVDVNVHPSKLEVRLSKEAELNELITNGIKDVFKQQQLIPSVESPKMTKTKSDDEQQQFTFDHTREVVNERPSAFQQTSLIQRTPIVEEKEQQLHNKIDDSWQYQDQIDEEFHDETETVIVHHEEEVFEENLSYDEKQKQQPLLQEERVPVLYPIGQMHGTYILAQNDRGLFIIDQHAAQERIKYEFFKEKVGQVHSEVQELLVPLTFEYSTDETMIIEEHLNALAQVGIFLEPFGRNSYIVRSHPQWFPRGEEKSTIEEIIQQVLDDKKINIKKLREEAAIMMSCKASIKANHHLRNDEIFALLETLRKTTDPFTCPHGRPIIVHYSTYEMEKMFKRVM
ncbi:DNA mismatch repair endonuclease MutL [Metabacillus litoralis]|uniref:DNA mismatch repair endonuclease MutL n=1 Tax=Metabacillus TaxID=2675233 RepID=UPI000EF5CF81|nr:DNA mismatch repair endonuclease MutL [Metabacillus litoralis]MCM3409176.1 DNA mismatch repair endonuclease MutL [Metabacillus litoralis]UHA59208.1 DNA mismatch repair endonuclease MutL [Metabacillus litoralis]